MLHESMRPANRTLGDRCLGSMKWANCKEPQVKIEWNETPYFISAINGGDNVVLFDRHILSASSGM